MMSSRERVFRAFRRDAARLPDRVPVQFDLCRKLCEDFGRELGIAPDYAPSYYEDLTWRISANAIRTALGSDCVVVGGTVARGFVPRPVRGTITENEFGMHMQPTSLYVEVVKCPLEEASGPADVEAYRFPDPQAPGRFEHARRDIDRFGRDFFVIGDVELSLFELAWHLTGMERYLLALASGEEWLEALNDRVEGWTLGLARQLVAAGVDALWFGEDLGSQTSTLISPGMWRELFKPRYRRMFAELRRLKPDLILIMHSDGAVAPLLEDFIELGVDVYNPVQPNVPGSDPRELKERFGGRIGFFGGIDQQVLMPSGDIPRLREEVRRRMAILGAGGGYLLAPAHVIQADVRPEVVRAMIDAVREEGAR